MQFTIEAMVSHEEDYILIDKIEAKYMDTTTTTSRPRSTKKPNPQPLSTGSSISSSAITTVFGLFAIAFGLAKGS
jgi:hypothetical protein